MPGRQAHGRPLLPASGKFDRPKSQPQNFKKSRARATSKALDAFALAAEQVGPESIRGMRTRGLEEHDGGRRHNQKRQHEDDDNDDEGDGFEDDDGEGVAPRNKRARRDGGDEDGFGGFSDDDGEGSEDSEEWHVGVAGEDEDSELDSDEAFGESDEERFEGGEEEEASGEGEDDLESLGSDAIDLATALDQFSEDEDGEEQGEGSSGSGSEDGDEESTEGDDESEEDEDEDDDEDDPSKLDTLQGVIAGFAGGDEEDGEAGTQIKTKLSLKDLGLFGVKDEHIKRSLRLMNKEEKAVKPGSSKKLDVPLAKRQQDRLLRSAAYEKTNGTLDRWIDTVKHNRRADHLMFPLAQNAHDRGLDMGELMPITQKTSGTELEQTILAIMEESGLGPSAKPKKEESEGDKQPGLSQAELKEIQRQRRLERERHSREMARAKRIKKIKSKAYRRIHRKELLREEEAQRDALAEAGALDSDEEREAQDRRRAMERMGTRHRESKWAKLGKKAGRAVWDDDFRAGLTDMARRKEELRRRVEGRKDGSEDDDGGSGVSDGSGDEDDRRRLLAELDRAAAYEDDDEPRSKLMQMKFMQRGEEQRKKENDELVAQLRRELDSDYDGTSDQEEMDIGRRQFGMGNSTSTVKPNTAPAKKKVAEASGAVLLKAAAETVSQSQPILDIEPAASVPSAAGAWSSVGRDVRKNNKASKSTAVELDFSTEAVPRAGKVSKPEPKPRASANGRADDAHNSDDEDAMHLPLAIRDQELLKRAFAGEDVAEDFEQEKAEIEQEDDEKEIDNTLPGWGGWVGEGVSNREKKRHQGRFVTKVEGVKKKDRKDFRLKGVIVNEKRVKKNDKYLATQLPHPFESQQQYERSLRLPVGPEWMTKETFQDATKPRVIIKQGIIAPMSKPMH
ncbi:hypothetical protein MMYC01_206402 [Madurella mycetomatis]|uniref:U3 small nucleolar RNA-associated protein 14 n=1 Tax=Madurella mycetomatis TaxID=100816 RepID=A0A175VZZ0_9PEZI|nr:hypothetical protein MMYC01_206402 [Madurella mycetomatis]